MQRDNHRKYEAEVSLAENRKRKAKIIVIRIPEGVDRENGRRALRVVIIGERTA